MRVSKKHSKALVAVSLVFTAVSTVSLPAQAGSLSDLFGGSKTQKSKFLPVEEAFQVQATTTSNKIKVTFDITEGHYVYRDKLKLKLPEGVTASKFSFNQKPDFINDPSFGRVAVFNQDSVIATAVLSNNGSKEVVPVTLKWQGCAKAGLCYPPEKIKLTVNLKKK